MRLRELRKEKQLLQREVAAAIGVSAQSYGYYENGINKPDPDTLIMLADLFECSVDYLIGRSDDFGAVTVVASSPTGEQLTPQEKKLLDEYRQLTYSNKLYVETYVSVRLEEQNGKTNTKHA